MGAYTNWTYSNLHELNLDFLAEEVKKLADEWLKLRADYDEWQTDLNQAFEDLETYVTTYFDNLDVDEAISNKLNIMAGDGSLSELVAPLIPEIIIEWLNEHIEPSTPIIDASLSVMGAGADAKVVGDYVLPDTSGNIEVGNFIEDSYVNHQGHIQHYEGWHRTDYIEIDPSKPLYITKFGTGSSGRYNCLFDENKNLLVAFPLNAGENFRPMSPYAKYLMLSDENTINYRIGTHDNVYNNEVFKHNKYDKNLFPYYNWVNGIINENGEIVLNYERIVSEKINVTPSATILVDNYNSDYDVYIASFDSEDNLIESSIYGDVQYELHNNVAYIRLVIRSTVTQYIYPTEVPTTDFYIRYLEKPYNSEAFEVMTFNMGQYGYGIDYGIPDEEYDEKICNYRNFLGEYYPAIMGIQEYSTVIRKTPEVRSEPALWDKYYPYRYRTGGSTALQSRYPLNDGGYHQMVTSPDRYYVDAYTMIDGKQVYLLSVHLTPTDSEAGRQKRIAEMNEVKSILEGHEYAICFGDFNPYPSQETELYSILTSVGYKCANFGDMGKFWTWTTNRADFDDYENPTGTVFYIDNIFVTPNIDILEVSAINSYDYLTSDHIPITAKLVLK